MARTPKVYEAGTQPGGVTLCRGSSGRYYVAVTTRSGWVDWPIMYDDSEIAYDAPEKVPLAWRAKVRRLLYVARKLNRGER